MITRLLKRWFNDSDDEDLTDFVRETRERSDHDAQVTHEPPSVAPRVTPPNPPTADLAPPVEESSSLIRNKYLREDTGTHETLTILDDSLVDSGEEQGIDPYNTGSFDRSKNWDRRRGK